MRRDFVPLAVSTATNASGAFGFINMPPASTYDRYQLTVAASGYGSFTLVGSRTNGDEKYATTVELSSTPQYADVTAASSTTARDSYTTVAASDTYQSIRRPPPQVRVAMHGYVDAQGRNVYSCSPAYGYLRTKTFPWRYYVENTLANEIGPGPWPGGPWFNSQAATAVAEAINSYGWHWMIHRKSIVPAGADLDNLYSDFQCFVPGRFVPFGWHVAVSNALANRIALDDGSDVAQASYLGDISCVSASSCPTYFEVSCTSSSPYYFADPMYPAGTLSQLGAKAASERCSVPSWEKIDNYYYRANGSWPGATVVPSSAPPIPVVSYETPLPGQITFHFSSATSLGDSARSLVAWTYAIEKGTSTGYHTIKRVRFSWSARGVPIYWTFNTSGCASYRVQATNPAGSSGYAAFNGGAPICA